MRIFPRLYLCLKELLQLQQWIVSINEIHQLLGNQLIPNTFVCVSSNTAITGLVKPLLALTVLSLESLVRFILSIPFFKVSGDVVLGLLRIGLAVQSKERIYSSSFQMQRQMETGAFSEAATKKCRTKTQRD